MGLFSFSKKGEDEISKRLDKDRDLLKIRKHQANKKNQLKLLPNTMKELRKIGISKNDELQLEYFFIAFSKEQGEKLNQVLKIEYHYNITPIQTVKNLFVVNGWTSKIKMETEVVENWLIKMCDLSLKYDSDFDGWGTTPEQEMIFSEN